MIGIYCITNTKNGMRYVGQSRNIEKRFKQHLTDDKKMNTKLGRDILAFDKSVFALTVLEECEVNLLDEREKYWIAKLGTFPNEYNMTPGGRDRVLDYDSIRALTKEQVREAWEEGLCIKDIIRKYGASSHGAIKNQLIEMGYSEIEINKRGQEQKKRTRAKRVAQLDHNGEVIKVFNSLNEAGRELNIVSQNIGKVCKGLRKEAGGFGWKYVEIEE